MLQQRQIVVKALCKQIDIECPVCMNCAIIWFHSISGCSYLSMLPYTGLDNHYTGHCIMLQLNLGAASRIMSIIESFGPNAATMGGGFFVGILIGYALKKMIKLVAMII